MDNNFNLFLIKNTNSYDRSVAILKYLSEDFNSYCKDCIYRYIAQSFYTKLDYSLLHKQNIDNNLMFQEIREKYIKNKSLIFPNIDAHIFFFQNNFYLAFFNLQAYNLKESIEDSKIAEFKHMNVSSIDDLMKVFHLSNVFFDNNININIDSIGAYKPSVEFRSKKQYQIIVKEQYAIKYKNISYDDILKINDNSSNIENSSLYQKIKETIKNQENKKLRIKN